MASNCQSPVAQNSPQVPVAVTMGDPAGIGLDLVVAAFAQRHQLGLGTFVLVADPAALHARARLIGRSVAIRPVAHDLHDLPPGSDALAVVPVSCSQPVIPGKPDPGNGLATIRAIEVAASLVRDGHASALVTNPIAKNILHAAGFAHPGHTEFLGELAHRLWGVVATPVMMLSSPELKVVPVTVHVALATVPGRLSQALIEATARTTLAALTTDFGIISPRLAVCGLNPHAGEAGLMGTEDQTIIAPAITALRALGCDVTGPHPADTLFHRDARRRYDAVLAMYHDQGLIPLKTIAFDHGVNVTLGLPFVRTSPDHGTAFDIAGTGKASISSFVAAMHLAAEIARRRSGQVA